MGDKIYYTILKTGEFRLGDLRLNIWLPVYLQKSLHAEHYKIRLPYMKKRSEAFCTPITYGKFS